MPDVTILTQDPSPNLPQAQPSVYQRPQTLLLSYTLLTLTASFILWLALAGMHKNINQMPWFLIYGMGALFPSLFGLYFTHYGGGWQALRALLKSAVSFRYPALAWVILFGLIPGINLVAILGAALLSWQAPHFSAALKLLSNPLGLPLVLLTTLLIGPLNEEFGWCGLALPNAAAIWGRARGNLVVGLIRFAWHLPMFLLVGSDQSKRPMLPFALGILGLSFLCGWLYDLTSRRVSAPILAHFTFNLAIGSLFPLNQAEYWIRGWLYLILIVVLFLRWRLTGLNHPD